MMSRGLSQEHSQKLLVDGYVEYVLQYFEEITKKEKQYIYTKII
jgi:Fe-S cluster assembly scaffold protein SufB